MQSSAKEQEEKRLNFEGLHFIKECFKEKKSSEEPPLQKYQHVYILYMKKYL